MSAGETEGGGSFGGQTSEIALSPDRQDHRDVRVFADGVAIPTIEEGVETEIRRDGPAALTRITDVWFPAEWRGEDVVGAIESFRPDGQVVPARVEFRPPSSESEDDFRTVHAGYARAIGSGGPGKLMRMRIGDLSDFLRGIPFAETYERPSVPTVLNDVLAEAEGMPFLSDLQLGGATHKTAEVEDVETAGTVETPIGSFTWSMEVIPGGEAGFADEVINEGRTFQSNRNVLIDALDWVALQQGLRWWVDYDPSDQRPVLIVDSLPRRKFADRWADSGGPTVRIRENEALLDNPPINQLTVVGKSPFSVSGFVKESINVASREFPVATARATRLYERVGETSLAPRRKEVRTTTLDATEAVAKKELREAISGANEGRLIIDGRPSMLPGDIIEMHMADPEEYPTASFAPHKVAVQRVRHVSPGGEQYAVDCDVTLDPGPIEIVDSYMQTMGG